MGLLEKIFGTGSNNSIRDKMLPGFKTFTDYNPVFTSYNGAIYEQALTRACIERFATACAKLEPELQGNPTSNIERIVKTRPSKFMSWPAFLSRLATIYECDATAFIVPIFRSGADFSGENAKRDIIGLQPLKCEYAEVLEYMGEPWFRFHFATGDTAALEMKYVAVITKFQYLSDFFGEPNCLDRTMQLIHAQEEAQDAAIKSGAKIRFIARVAGQMREDDMRKKRNRFAEDNFGPDNNSGLMIYDTTFQDVEQVKPNSWTVDTDEMENIRNNCLTYFGTNMDILQNHYNEDMWGAWYEGKIEPFAVKVGEALTNMLFTERMQMQSGTRFTFSSNRLEYSSNASKRNMGRDMFDRGIMSRNEVREMLQMPKIADGDEYFIRGEYINIKVADLYAANANGGVGGPALAANNIEKDKDAGGDDQMYQESDAHEQGDEEN